MSVLKMFVSKQWHFVENVLMLSEEIKKECWWWHFVHCIEKCGQGTCHSRHSTWEVWELFKQGRAGFMRHSTNAFLSNYQRCAKRLLLTIFGIELTRNLHKNCTAVGLLLWSTSFHGFSEVLLYVIYKYDSPKRHDCQLVKHWRRGSAREVLFEPGLAQRI